MQQDVNVTFLSRHTVEEIFGPHPLAPIAARATSHVIRPPQALVVVPGLAGLASAVVVVLLEEAAARLGALRDAVDVGIGVDILRHGALELRGEYKVN